MLHVGRSCPGCVTRHGDCVVATLHGTGTYSDAALLPDTAVITWTVTSGPGNVLFGDAASLDTTATFDQTGDYVLRLTIDDGLQTEFDELTIAVS